MNSASKQQQKEKEAVRIDKDEKLLEALYLNVKTEVSEQLENYLKIGDLVL
jgi:hypothetical protein